MPTEDYLQILLPRAMDRGNGIIGVRRFNGKLYCKATNDFRVVQIKKIQYAPSWAKVEASVDVFGRTLQKSSGDNGLIAIETEATSYAEVSYILENNSIDTDVMFTMYLIGWQIGEG